MIKSVVDLNMPLITKGTTNVPEMKEAVKETLEYLTKLQSEFPTLEFHFEVK